MRRCRKNRKNIAAWPDLAEPERRRLREHALGCAGCREELEGTLAVLERLEASREAYSGLRYTGPRPSLNAQRALAPAEGIRTFPNRGLWRPMPVAVAGGLFAVSLAIYLLIVSQPPAPLPELPPEPIATTAIDSDEASGASGRLRAGPPNLRPSSAAASLEAIRRQASRLQRPQTPRRPSGFGLRLPKRPTRPALPAPKPRPAPPAPEPRPAPPAPSR